MFRCVVTEPKMFVWLPRVLISKQILSPVSSFKFCKMQNLIAFTLALFIPVKTALSADNSSEVLQ